MSAKPDTDTTPIPLPSDPVVIMLAILVAIACLTAVYLASDIVIPVVMAAVLKLLFEPLMRLLRRARMPRIVAAIIVMLLVFGALTAIAVAVSGPATEWAMRLPEGVSRLQERLSFLAQPIEKTSEFLRHVDELTGGAGVGNGLGSALATTLLMSTTHLASSFFELLIVLFFLLSSGGVFLGRLVELLPTFRDKRQAVEMSLDIERKISGYLVTITAMNLLVGVATGVVMWALGMRDPLLWAVVAFLLNYVPILGPLAGVFIFLLAGFIEIESTAIAVLPAALYLAIHLAEGEWFTPRLLAKRFTINPVLVVISLIFWFWMWGVVGAVLAVPMLAITRILCDGIEPLRAFGHFLAGEE